jgi:phosphoglycerate dehydrogenase-like enzyme
MPSARSAHRTFSPQSAPEPAGEPRIVFLDDDHVIKLARLLLSSSGPEDERWVGGFFAPEQVDVGGLLELGAGLRYRDGVAIELAGPSGPPVGTSIIAFRRGAVGAETIGNCPDLRLIQRLGEDCDPIDRGAAAALGVEVSCLPRRTLRHTADHAMALILALAKRLLAADRAVRAGVGADGGSALGEVAYNWAGLDGVGGLTGRRLGIVGFGEVGRLLAARARGFEMRVLYTSPLRLSATRERQLGVEFVALEQLLERSEFVSLHVPGTAANRGLIGAAEIARMAPGAFLVNTSRGSVVDEDALYDALLSGRLAGAGLDVHASEPRPASDRFCGLENVILTPHVSGGSRRGVLAEIASMFDNFRSVLAGSPPIHGRVPLPEETVEAPS